MREQDVKEKLNGIVAKGQKKSKKVLAHRIEEIVYIESGDVMDIFLWKIYKYCQ